MRYARLDIIVMCYFFFLPFARLLPLALDLAFGFSPFGFDAAFGLAVGFGAGTGVKPSSSLKSIVLRSMLTAAT